VKKWKDWAFQNGVGQEVFGHLDSLLRAHSWWGGRALHACDWAETSQLAAFLLWLATWPLRTCTSVGRHVLQERRAEG